MNARHGFALISVLWLTAMLGVLLTLGVAPAIVVRTASENRVYMARARWAALGCLELLRARHANGIVEAPLDSVALGSVVWCSAESVNPDERINPSVGDSVGLHRVLDDAVRVASVLDWIDADTEQRESGAEASWYVERARRLPRNAPLADVAELALVRGFEAADPAGLERLFTTSGNGAVSPNRAPLEVLRSVSVLPPEGAATLVRLRARRRFATPEEVASVLGLRLTTAGFRTLTERLSFADGRRTVRLHGSADAGRRIIRTSITATLADADDRLAVLRVEVR